RPLRRITVFHDEVRYPRPALPLAALPEELVEYFRRVFVDDRRGVVPRPLIETLRWTTCRCCGVEHARPVCPRCRLAPPAGRPSVVRGRVTATRIFGTRGVIVAAALEAGALRWLYHEDGVFRREDGSTVCRGGLDPRIRFRLLGEATILAREGRLARLAPGRP